MGAFNGRGRVFREFLIPAVLFVLLCPVLCAQTTETLSRTFHFEKPVVKEVHADGASFASVRMKSTISLGRHAGEPALPVRCVKFLLPPGRQVTAIEVKGVLSDFETAGVDLTTSPVFPHQPPLPLGKKAASRPNGLAFDEKLYASSRPFPAEDFSGPKTGVCRGYTIYSMNLHPVKYVPAAGLLLRQQEMTVKLTLENRSTQSPLFRNSPADKVWVKRLVCNPESAAEYEEAGGHGNVSGGRTGPGYPGGLCDPADQYDYVILTTTQNGLDHWSTGGSTPYNWQSLMDRHAVDGLACTLVTLEQILAEPDYENPDPLFDDAPARIREFARDAYLDWGIQYLLVGGDDEWIPAREMDYQYESDVDSDVYWSHLDGTFNDDLDSEWGEVWDTGIDLYSEIYIGRITCDEPQDVSNWLNKLFFYMDSEDPDYLDNAAFYGGNTGWPCEGDDYIDYSAIKGADHWMGPNPDLDPIPNGSASSTDSKPGTNRIPAPCSTFP